MKTVGMNFLAVLVILSVAAGCSKTLVAPRFAGRVVSHVDAYGSGTGGESALSADGSMASGFDYGNPAKHDWTSDIKWAFLRQDGGTDVYRIEWTFRPTNGTTGTKTKEVSFDGTNSVKVFENQWQVISIEPAPMKMYTQQVDGEGHP